MVKWIFKGLKSLRAFSRDSSGNVAMMFGLASLGLIGAAGLALDYTNAETMRTKMAAAADSAVLAGAAATGKTEAERLAIAQKQFDAGIGAHAGIESIVLTGNDVIESGKVIGFRVNVSGSAPTTLGRLFGLTSLPLGVGAQATSGASERIEMALVLDKTGSMAGSKMTALQTAANDMINNLLAKAAEPGQVRFAIAPFAEHVQVGLHRAGEPWLSVPASVTTSSCWNTYPNATSSNCRMETQIQDGTPVQVNVCDWNYGAPVEVCGTYTAEWRGCVGSRTYPLNIQDGTYSTPVPGLLDTWCGPEIVPLTHDQTALNAAISGMTSWGDTYIPSGLVWGWRMLSTGAPFDETQHGKIPQTVKRYVVLMTDGMNTRSPNYPDNWGSDTNLANTLTAELCANIKADGINIFTIAFEVTDNTIKNILRQCASNPSQFFDAGNAGHLAAAFKKIGDSLASLRLTR